jgi:hypothetical protein
MAVRDRRKRRADPVLAKIDSIRRTVVSWTMGWGYLWVALLVGVMVFAGVLLDHAFVLQKWGRVAFSRALLLGLVGGGAVATLFPLLKRMGRLYVARRMEQSHPELKNALISYLQCRADPDTPRELKRLMQRKAHRHIQSLDSAVVVDYSRFVRLSMALAALVLVFMFYFAFSPKSAATSVRRLLRPRAAILPPTGTRLVEIEPGDVYVIVGSEPRLRVRVEGVRPDGVQAVWDGESFEGRRLLLTEKEDGRWEGAFPAVLESGSYYVAAGDTRSDRFAITALARPAVAELRLTLRPPAYTRLPVRTAVNSDVEVPVGTSVTVGAETNLPPRIGHVEFGSGRRVWLEPVEGRNELAGEFNVTRSDACMVRFETVEYPDGSSFQNPSPVRYAITARGDEAPTIRLLGPPDGAEAAPNDTVTLTYEAADDYEVTRVALKYQINAHVAREVALAEPGVPKVPRADYAWDLSELPLRPGSVVAYHLEAEDNRPERAQVGRSETRRIVIPGPEEERDSSRTAPPPPEEEAGGREPSERRRPPPEEEAPDKRDAEAEQDEPQTSERTESPEPSRVEREPSADEPGPPGAIEEYARRIAELLGERQPPPDREGAPERVAEREERARGGARDDAAPREPTRESEPGPAGEAPERDRQQEPEAAPELVDSERESGEGDEGPDTATRSEEPSGPRPPGAPSETGPRRPSAEASEQGEAGGGTCEACGGALSPDGTCESCGAGGGQGAGEGQGGGQGAAGDQGDAGEAAGEGRQGAGGLPGQGREAASGRGGQAEGQEPGTRPGQGGAGAAGTGVRELPPAGPPEDDGLPVRDVDAAIEELARMLERDEMPAELLDDLGTDRESLREFIERYRRARRGERPERQAAEESLEPGGRVIGVRRAAAGVEAGDARPEEVNRDALRSRFEGSRERLSPRYREVVDRYYKALSEEQ